ncbi:MAG: DUF397 domain-containing protein [Actinomycetota bacterium]|nr:DUF397 domain-containing protein [Actinomycetota bacterium]
MTEMRWRKSSRSGEEGNCVELAWRKSSRSGHDSNCVELAPGAIRDSKNPAGPVLLVPDMPAFLREIKRGRFDPR